MKNILILKKSSKFAYLLMEKPDNWFSIIKKWRRKTFKKSISIFTWNLTLGQFSVSACVNQATGFSVNGSSTPNGLFQTINGLLQTAP